MLLRAQAIVFTDGTLLPWSPSRALPSQRRLEEHARDDVLAFEVV